MATKVNIYPTLLDVARQLDPNGNSADIVEMLNQMNPLAEDAVYLECNDGTSHKTTVRNGLPTVAWRKAYEGVMPSKSQSTQVSATCGRLEAVSEVDEMILELAKDKNGFRLNEAAAFTEAMAQEHSSTFIYGNSGVTPAKFTGLAVQFSQYGGTDTTKTAFNVLDGGGRGATNTSVYFVGWGPRSVHCIFPQGSKAGIEHKDEGRFLHQNSDGSNYPVYGDRWIQNVGLVVRDWRYVVRVCNIDVSKLGTAQEADLFRLLIEGYNKISRYLGGARFAIYANRTIKTWLDIQSYDKVKATTLNFDNRDGKPVLSFRGVPVRECDALLDTEAAVAAVA
jgi:hypothetical protein